MQTHFDNSGFGPADYTNPTFSYTFVGLPVTLPNPKGRGWTLRRHDLHHALHGYSTSLGDECRISAFEIGSSLVWGGMPGPGWFFNLALMFLGLLFTPASIIEHYTRGKSWITLYSYSDVDLIMFEGLPLQQALDQVRMSAEQTPSVKDTLQALGWGLPGFVAGAILTVMSLFGVIPGLIGKARS